LGPELTKVVFERGASQTQTVTRLQTAHGGGSAAGGVLDGLRLVEDEEVKMLG